MYSQQHEVALYAIYLSECGRQRNLPLRTMLQLAASARRRDAAKRSRDYEVAEEPAASRVCRS